MSRLERNMNLLGVVVPFLGVIVAIVLLWNSAVNATDLAIMVVMYAAHRRSAITVGFHRLLTHRAFQTYPWLERTFAVLGSLAVQGSVLDWVADHRKHHAFTDVEGDPHSPHVGHGSGLRGPLARARGLADRDPGSGRLEEVRARPLRGPGDAQDRPALPAAGAGLAAIPTVAGFVLSGFTAKGALEGYIWGGLVRIFFVHHVTWSINSICHIFGTRRFEVEDQSTNVWWLAPFSLGESWHHNHHAFPRSAFHGLQWCELDISGLHHPRDGEARARLERRPDHARAPAPEVARPVTGRVRAGARAGRAPEPEPVDRVRPDRGVSSPSTASRPTPASDSVGR